MKSPVAATLLTAAGYVLAGLLGRMLASSAGSLADALLWLPAGVVQALVVAWLLRRCVRAPGAASAGQEAVQRLLLGGGLGVLLSPAWQRAPLHLAGWPGAGLLLAILILVAAVIGALLLWEAGPVGPTGATQAQPAGAPGQERLRFRDLGTLHQVAEANVIGMLIADITGRIADGNDAFLEMIGYSRDELERGLRWDQLLTPESLAGSQEMLQRLVQTGAVPAWEKEYQHKDGSRVTVLSCVAALDGHPDYYMVFLVDVSKRRRVERDLERQTAALERQAAELERYKVIVDSIPAIIFIKEYSEQRQGVYLLANPTCSQLIGHPDPVGHTDYELMPENLAEQMHGNDLRVLEGREPVVIEEAVLDTDSGELISTLATKMPLFAADGEPYAVAGIALDISRQKQLNERLRGLVDAIPDAMFRMRSDGLYLDMKDSRGILFMFPAQDLLGTNLQDAPLPEEVRDLAMRAIREAIRTGEVQEIEYRLDVPGGERYYEARMVKSGRDEAVALVRDITEARYTRLALEETNAKLRAANEELGEFAYVASHDLQEPLRTVHSFVELLERRYGDAFDERGRKWLGLIVSGTQRMRSLIDDLLAYSRVGRTGEVARVDMAHLVREALDDARASIEATGAVVEVGALPVVTANATELRQVILNLVSNALKFRRPGVALRVTIDAEETPQGWAFCVSDNGIGIERDYHERIFQVFQRLHPREEYPGTGIGLALVKKIIERQGGEISVCSTPGEGTSFCFTLPATPRSEPAALDAPQRGLGR